MPVDVTMTTEIARPRAEVAEFAADPDNATAWYVHIQSVQWRTPPPLQVGSRLAFVARFLRRRLAYTYTVRELEPGTRLVMRTDQGPFPMETSYTWADTTTGGTLMTLRNRGEPRGLARMGSPLVAAAMRRANRQDLDRLRTILEGRPAG